MAVALHQFTQNGYEGTPLRAISDELGMTKAALYYHFDSKQALLQELLTPALDTIDELLSTVREDAHDGKWRRELLAGYADALMAHLPAIRILARDLHATMQPGIGERIDAHMEVLQALLIPEDADDEERTRAFAALTVLQRVLIGHRGRPPGTDGSAEDLRKRALCIAMEILTNRCP